MAIESQSSRHYANYKLDLYFAIDYFFAGTHYPFYVKKYAKYSRSGDLETRIVEAVKHTNMTR